MLANYYRSDMVHKRSKQNLQILISQIKASSLTEKNKELMQQILENNECGTLENIDAVARFRFLLKDDDFINFLKLLQWELNEFSEDENTVLKLSYGQAFEEIKLLRIHFIKVWSDLHTNLGMSFDFSYTYSKGKSWERTHNIF